MLINNLSNNNFKQTILKHNTPTVYKTTINTVGI